MKISKFLILILLSSQANAQIVNDAAQKQGQVSNVLIRQPAALGAVSIPVTTSDCMGSTGIGTQGQFFGLSLSRSTQSKPCNIREDTKIAELVLHDDVLARAIFMQGEYAKATIRENRTVQNDVCDYPTDECKKAKRFK